MTTPDRKSNATGNSFVQNGPHGTVGSGRVVSYGMGRGAAPGVAPAPQAGYVSQAGVAVPQVGVVSHGVHQVGATAPQAAVPQPSSVAPCQPGTFATPQHAPKKKRRAGFFIAIVVALLAVIIACLLVFTMCNGGKAKRQGSLGQLEGKTAEEVQAEIDRVVDEGMFNISIASVVEMASGTSPAELRIENVPGNRYLMKVVITRDDTGEQIYETDLIEPNHHIQSDVLDVNLPAGTYDCTATFSAFQPETEEMAGQAAAKILVQVQS